MLDLNDLYYFASVVKYGGFSSASRALDTPKSSLSRRVGRLEQQVGIRLLERSTRSIKLTDLGQEFYLHCQAMIAEAEAAEETAARELGLPRGVVRVSCPPGLAQSVLAAKLPAFLQQYPEVRLQLRVSNRRVDLVDDRLDIAVRVRSKLDTDGNLVMRTLAHSRLLLVASPGLLERAPALEAVDDIRQLPTISMNEEAGEDSWTLTGPDGEETQIVHVPRLSSSDFGVLLDAAIDGVGLAFLPDTVCAQAIRSGQLVHVLPDYFTRMGIVHLVFASRRGLLPAVRVVIDFLVESFKRGASEASWPGEQTARP
jgi:DNA-binding transcriptional LysR family regulator